MGNPVTRDVVYYHHRIPSDYFKGKGWRGTLVRVLNYCRWRLQIWCAYHSMIVLAKAHVPDKETIAALKLRWDEEQSEESTRRPVLGVFGQMEAEFGVKHRLAEGRKNGPWPGDTPVDQTHAQFARYLRGPRQGVYTHARDSILVEEPEWEVVE